MSSYRRALWLYPIFQIPLAFLGIFLTAALLFWLLKFGRPQVAVAIALDISNSTHGGGEQLLDIEGTIFEQEVQAVEAYLEQNNAEVLRRPNQIKVFGFGDQVTPLTSNFESNSQQVKQELSQTLTRDGLLQAIVPDRTNIDLATETGIDALKTVPDHCKELILVTDGEASLSARVVTSAVTNQVKLNAVVIGAEEAKGSELKAATFATRGKYLSGDSNNLDAFFTNDLFDLFNSNLRWIIFWLGLAWISLMWVLVLPLDRWLFQKLLQMQMDMSGKLALANALFWTVLTLIALWQIWGIPFLSIC